jgi:hypothetical protein
VQLGLAKAPAEVTSARHAPLASWLEPVTPAEVPVILAMCCTSISLISAKASSHGPHRFVGRFEWMVAVRLRLPVTRGAG